MQIESPTSSIGDPKTAVPEVEYQPYYVDLVAPTQGGNPLVEYLVVFLSVILCIVTFPFSLACIFVVVRQFERIVILRNGKIYGGQAFGPGLVWHLPCIDTIKFTDLRIVCYTVPPQECLTKDSLTVTVQAVLYYRIYDPMWAIMNVSNFKLSTKYLAATTLRNEVGSRKLSELLANRSEVSSNVLQLMKQLTREWGIYVVRTEIKDIYLPLQLQKAMAAEAESTRIASAKIIVASSEIESTKSLQIATEMLMDNPLCMQLRYLQSLHMIASDKTHTIVVPYSEDLVNSICSKIKVGCRKVSKGNKGGYRERKRCRTSPGPNNVNRKYKNERQYSGQYTSRASGFEYPLFFNHEF